MEIECNPLYEVETSLISKDHGATSLLFLCGLKKELMSSYFEFLGSEEVPSKVVDLLE